MDVCVLSMMVLSVGFSIQNFAQAELQCRYEVAEVLAVRSLSEFECRLKDYPYSKAARFRVQIRGVVLNSQIPQAEAQEYLVERLKNVDRIQLKKIEFRNYFRVTADVTIDGADLATELVSQRLAQIIPTQTDRKMPLSSGGMNRVRQVPSVVHQRAGGSSFSDSNEAKTEYVTLESLMNKKVDLSAINEETSFKESLEILSNSVRPRLPLVVLWNDLENNAMVDKEMPIGLGGFGSLKLKQALKLILLSVSRNGMELKLAFEGRVITVGTQRGLLQKSRVRTYAVADLTSASFSEDDQIDQGNRDD